MMAAFFDVFAQFSHALSTTAWSVVENVSPQAPIAVDAPIEIKMTNSDVANWSLRMLPSEIPRAG